MREKGKAPMIAPSILSADFSCLGAQVKAVEEAGADALHVDVMDGRFVPNITIGPLIVEAMKRITALPLDVHLMIQDPGSYVLPFQQAGADWLTIHIESPGHHHRIIQHIKELGMKAGVALNPSTPLTSIEWLMTDLDLVLIMSVNPGFGGQSFIPQCMEKIKKTREIMDRSRTSAILAVDGGIKADNCLDVATAGADCIVMGSAIFGGGSPGGTLKRIKEGFISTQRE